MHLNERLFRYATSTKVAEIHHYMTIQEEVERRIRLPGYVGFLSICLYHIFTAFYFIAANVFIFKALLLWRTLRKFWR